MLTNAPPDPLRDDGAALIDDARRRRVILIATCLALMAVVASASGISVAQQELSLDLNASQGTVLWVINSYVIALAALLLPMGAIADRWGRKPVLIAGLIFFCLSTGAAALVDTGGLMIAVRLLAGVSAAMIMPVTLSVITTSFPPEARSQAIGVWTAVGGSGGLLGMIASALLVDLANWRLLFALPVLLAGAALAMALRVVPNSREHSGAPYDLTGAVLSVVGIGGLVLGIYGGPQRGWLETLTVACLGGGVLALAAFAAHELRHGAPLLDIRVFCDRALAAGSSTLLVVFGISAGVFVVLFPFFQAVLGWTAFDSILGLLPTMAVMMGASAAAAAVSARIGARATSLGGVAATAIGLAAMAAMVSVDGGYTALLPGLLLVGLGMGLTMPPATETITSSLPAERQGVASALNDTTRELGTAIGIALLGAVLAAVYSDSMDAALSRLPQGIPDAAGDGIGRAFDIAAQRDDAQAAAIIDAAREAFIDGWATSMWVGAAATGVLLLYLALSGSWTARREVEPPGRDAQPASVPSETVEVGTGP